MNTGNTVLDHDTLLRRRGAYYPQDGLWQLAVDYLRRHGLGLRGHFPPRVLRSPLALSSTLVTPPRIAYLGTVCTGNSGVLTPNGLG
jgi:hypothetical protein